MAAKIGGILGTQYQYFHNITNDFSDTKAFTKGLEEIDRDTNNLFDLAEFVVKDLTAVSWGEKANTEFMQFIKALNKVDSEIWDDDDNFEIQILCAKRVGCDGAKALFGSKFKETLVREKHKESVLKFLGDVRKIDDLGNQPTEPILFTLKQRVQNLAFKMFAGPRNLLDSPYSKHLARLGKVFRDSSDLKAIQLVMHKLYTEQIKEVMKSGFMFRDGCNHSNGYGKLKGSVDENQITRVKVVLCIGQKLFYELQNSFTNCPSNILQIPFHHHDESIDVQQYENEAIEFAVQHFDSPMMVIADIIEEFIVNNHILAEGLYSKFLREAQMSRHDGLAFLAGRPTPPLERKFTKIEVPLENLPPLTRENLQVHYPQAAPEVLQRLEHLLFEPVPTPLPNVQTPQRPQSEELDENMFPLKPVLLAAIFAFSFFIVMKYRSSLAPSR